MKRLFLLCFAVSVTAGCSCPDYFVPGSPSAEIRFHPLRSTRGAELTTDLLSGIVVTALDVRGSNYFTDVPFSRSGLDFVPLTPRYWPMFEVLTFYAYAPEADVLGAPVRIDRNARILSDYRPSAQITDQQDFITATARGSRADNGGSGVLLSFSHRLSQIELQGLNRNETYHCKVRGIRIAMPVSRGTFDFDTGSWMLGGDKAIYEVTYDAARDLGATGQSLMSGAGDNALLLPQRLTPWDETGDPHNEGQGAYLSVLVNITKRDGSGQLFPDAPGAYGWAAVAIDTEWEAGNKYVYTLNFTDGAGKVDPADPEHGGESVLGTPLGFSVAVEPWAEADQDLDM